MAKRLQFRVSFSSLELGLCVISAQGEAGASGPLHWVLPLSDGSLTDEGPVLFEPLVGCGAGAAASLSVLCSWVDGGWAAVQPDSTGLPWFPRLLVGGLATVLIEVKSQSARGQARLEFYR